LLAQTSYSLQPRGHAPLTSLTLQQGTDLTRKATMVSLSLTAEPVHHRIVHVTYSKICHDIKTLTVIGLLAMRLTLDVDERESVFTPTVRIRK
jgi:hypothetical protein